MPGDTNLILTGFMGTGKSTVGRIVADERRMAHIDVDDVIEERYGPIATIFAEGGEARFQDVEQEVASDLAGLKRSVISTGGQTMLHEANVRTLGSSGIVICLVASPERIYERLSADPGLRERPMLSAPDTRVRIAELLDQRAEGYAHFPQLATDNLDPPAAAKAVIALWESLIKPARERR